VVTAGTLVAGVAGAFVSVPIAAVLWRVLDTVQRHRAAERNGTGVPAPTADPGRAAEAAG